MDNRNYPKILIIGQNFNKIDGGGITLTNLFMGWDKDNIAVASFNIDLTQTSICTSYYQIGNDEEKWIFPFNYLQRKIKSGPILLNTQNYGKKDSNHRNNIFTRVRESELKELLKKFFRSSLHFWGVYNLFYKLRISAGFITWVKDFKPDIIYTQLSSLALIRFVDKLQQLIDVPIAIHIMDDWPKTIASKGFFSLYWKRVIDHEFRELINKSSYLMSICQSMSDEYKIRYGKDFIPFHNPIDLTIWKKESKNKWNIKHSFYIVYAGRVGNANQKSIFDICKSTSILNKEGTYIYFDIYTPDYQLKRVLKLNKFQGVSIHPSIPHEDIPPLLAGADLLVIPLDFDKKSIKFAGFSMPGKTSEYMASGTPILVYAPAETALIHYTDKEKWGFVVNERNLSLLSAAIKQLYSDKFLREQLGKHARELAFKNHNAIIVRDNFHKLFTYQRS